VSEVRREFDPAGAGGARGAEPAEPSRNSVCFCGGGLIRGEWKGYHFQRCAACGYTNMNLNYSAEEIRRLYDGSGHSVGYKYSDGRKFNSLVNAIRGWYAKVRIGSLNDVDFPRAGVVLDFGCGQGYFLDALRALGIKAKGVEVTEESARFAREKGNDVVLDLAVLPAAIFDAIFSIHVLEHIPLPAGVLDELHRVSKDGAFFSLEVPNFSSVQGRLFRFRWFHADLGVHFHHFTPRSFRALLDSAGFSVGKMEFVSWEQGVMGWLQSIYNLVFPYNRFYRAGVLKSGTHGSLDILPEIILFPLALPVALLCFFLESLIGSGAVIRVSGVIRSHDHAFDKRESVG
jgi:SAM-dependent methyltransferase